MTRSTSLRVILCFDRLSMVLPRCTRDGSMDGEPFDRLTMLRTVLSTIEVRSRTRSMASEIEPSD